MSHWKKLSWSETNELLFHWERINARWAKRCCKRTIWSLSGDINMNLMTSTAEAVKQIIPAAKSWTYIHCQPLALTAARSECEGGVISAVLKQPEHIIISSLTSFVTRKTSLQPAPNPGNLPSTSKNLLRRNRVIKETCGGSKACLTIQAARWGFLQLEICKSQILFFNGLGEYKERKISTMSHDFSPLCPFWKG